MLRERAFDFFDFILRCRLHLSFFNVMNYLKNNIDITELSNYKTPATARWYFEVRTKQDITKLFEICTFAKKEKLEILWISGGTNMLFAFEEFN